MFNRIKTIVSAVVAIAGTVALAGGVYAAETRGTYSVGIGEPVFLTRPVVESAAIITEPMRVLTAEPIIDRTLVESAVIPAPAGRFVLFDDDGSPTVVTNEASMFYTGPRFENTLTLPVQVSTHAAVIETRLHTTEAPAIIETEMVLPAVFEPSVDLTPKVISDTTKTTTRTRCE